MAIRTGIRPGQSHLEFAAAAIGRMRQQRTAKTPRLLDNSSEARRVGLAIYCLATWRLGGSTDPSHIDPRSARSASFPNAIPTRASTAPTFPIPRALV
jgi:hypothetical protein